MPATLSDFTYCGCLVAGLPYILLNHQSLPDCFHVLFSCFLYIIPFHIPPGRFFPPLALQEAVQMQSHLCEAIEIPVLNWENASLSSLILPTTLYFCRCTVNSLALEFVVYISAFPKGSKSLQKLSHHHPHALLTLFCLHYTYPAKRQHWVKPTTCLLHPYVETAENCK